MKHLASVLLFAATFLQLSPALAANLERTLPAWPGRSYEIHLPANAAGPVPLIVFFHGYSHDAKKMLKVSCENGDLTSASCADAIADRLGFAIAYPNGTVDPKGVSSFNAGGGKNGAACSAGYSCETKVDDVGFYDAIVADVKSLAQIDTKRIYIAGLSNGAAMAHRLACERSESIAAIAAIGGANQYAAADACILKKPVSVLSIHGVADPIWPYYGAWSFSGYAASSDDSARAWSDRNDCPLSGIDSKYSDEASDGTSVLKTIWGGCKDGSEVIRYTINGGGHTWPRGWQFLPESRIGVTSKELNATEVVFEFFSRH